VQRALSDIGASFLCARPSDGDKAVSAALERMGRVLDCTIATIWDDGSDGKVHRNHVWVDPAKSSLSDYPIATISLHNPVSLAVRESGEPSVVRFADLVEDADARRTDTIIAAPFLDDRSEGEPEKRVVGAVTFAMPRFDDTDDWWSEFWLASVGNFASLLSGLRKRIEVETALIAGAAMDLAKSRISTLLTDNSPEQHGETIEAVLGIAGAALAADSLSFYGFDHRSETASLHWSWRSHDQALVAETTDAGPAIGDQDVAIGRVDTRVGPHTEPLGVLTARPGTLNEWDSDALQFIRWLANAIGNQFERVESRRAVIARSADDGALRKFGDLLSGLPTSEDLCEATELLKLHLGASHVSIWRMFIPDRLEGRVPRELVARSRHPDGERLEVDAETALIPATVAAKIPPPGETLDYPLDFVPTWVRATVGHDLEAAPRRATITSAHYAGAELMHIFCLSDGDLPIDSRRKSLLFRAAHLLSGALSRAAEEAKFAVAFESAPSAITIRDAEGRLIDCNSAYEEFTSRPRSELIGRPVEEVVATKGMAPKPDNWAGPTDIEYEMPGGQTKWGRVRASDVVLPGLPGTQTLCHIEDITDTLAATERLRFHASHDSLTGLQNRRAFIESVRIQTCDTVCERGCTILVIDLDNFRVVNDTFGHQVGDSALVEIAGRLVAVVGDRGTVCRLAGDEFGIHLSGNGDETALDELGMAILETVKMPVRVSNLELELSASIGSASAQGCDGDLENLLRRADEAMYHAKSGGRDCWMVYDEQLEREITERTLIESELRDAIDGNQMEVHYQPEVRLSTGHIVGTEALVRWHHPTRGLLTAGAFIEVAEQTGMIVELGRWVLEEATRQAVYWNGLGHHLTMRVNLSARQLRPAVVDEIKAALTKSGLRPDRLCLEVTETAIMDDVNMATDLLQAISGLGVKLAIDDFGTGYSSLAYLKKFPFDILKIDKSFVDGVGIDDEDSGIIETIVNLARVLRLDIVAEGIENPRQIDDLARLGVDRAQGFYLARPAPPHDIEKLLSD